MSEGLPGGIPEWPAARSASCWRCNRLPGEGDVCLCAQCRAALTGGQEDDQSWSSDGAPTASISPTRSMWQRWLDYVLALSAGSSRSTGTS